MKQQQQPEQEQQLLHVDPASPIKVLPEENRNGSGAEPSNATPAATVASRSATSTGAAPSVGVVTRPAPLNASNLSFSSTDGITDAEDRCQVLHHQGSAAPTSEQQQNGHGAAINSISQSLNATAEPELEELQHRQALHPNGGSASNGQSAPPRENFLMSTDGETVSALPRVMPLTAPAGSGHVQAHISQHRLFTAAELDRIRSSSMASTAASRSISCANSLPTSAEVAELAYHQTAVAGSAALHRSPKDDGAAAVSAPSIQRHPSARLQLGGASYPAAVAPPAALLQQQSQQQQQQPSLNMSPSAPGAMTTSPQEMAFHHGNHASWLVGAAPPGCYPTQQQQQQQQHDAAAANGPPIYGHEQPSSAAAPEMGWQSDEMLSPMADHGASPYAEMQQLQYQYHHPHHVHGSSATNSYMAQQTPAPWLLQSSAWSHGSMDATAMNGNGGVVQQSPIDADISGGVGSSLLDIDPSLSTAAPMLMLPPPPPPLTTPLQLSHASSAQIDEHLRRCHEWALWATRERDFLCFELQRRQKSQPADNGNRVKPLNGPASAASSPSTMMMPQQQQPYAGPMVDSLPQVLSIAGKHQGSPVAGQSTGAGSYGNAFSGPASASALSFFSTDSCDSTSMLHRHGSSGIVHQAPLVTAAGPHIPRDVHTIACNGRGQAILGSSSSLPPQQQQRLPMRKGDVGRPASGSSFMTTDANGYAINSHSFHHHAGGATTAPVANISNSSSSNIYNTYGSHRGGSGSSASPPRHGGHHNRCSHDNTPQDQKYLQTDPFSMYEHNKKKAAGVVPTTTAATATGTDVVTD